MAAETQPFFLLGYCIYYRLPVPRWQRECFGASISRTAGEVWCSSHPPDCTAFSLGLLKCGLSETINKIIVSLGEIVSQRDTILVTPHKRPQGEQCGARGCCVGPRGASVRCPGAGGLPPRKSNTGNEKTSLPDQRI